MLIKRTGSSDKPAQHMFLSFDESTVDQYKYI